MNFFQSPSVMNLVYVMPWREMECILYDRHQEGKMMIMPGERFVSLLIHTVFIDHLHLPN